MKGLGSVLATLRVDGRPLELSKILTPQSNHVWLPQLIYNNKDDYKSISICFNCGSIMEDGEFIDAQKEEKSKEEK